jgi:hypothetical protein
MSVGMYATKLCTLAYLEQFVGGSFSPKTFGSGERAGMKAELPVPIVGQLGSGLGEGESSKSSERRLLEVIACSDEVVLGGIMFISASAEV